MPFIPLQISRQGVISLTIDKHHRIRLSSSALKDLAIPAFTPVIVSVDVENKRVGIVKQDLAKIPNASVVRPDKRGYLGVAAGKLAISKLALADADLPAKFNYVGTVDEGSVFWHTFEYSGRSPE